VFQRCFCCLGAGSGKLDWQTPYILVNRINYTFLLQSEKFVFWKDLLWTTCCVKKVIQQTNKRNLIKELGRFIIDCLLKPLLFRDVITTPKLLQNRTNQQVLTIFIAKWKKQVESSILDFSSAKFQGLNLKQF
jgi:hypothetical protein